VTAYGFMCDLKERLANRVQLTSDGLKSYVSAVGKTFGNDVDFAQLVKIYGPSHEGQRRYSPPVCKGAIKDPRTGNPDPDHISTSYVERSNLTMRMHMRRFTRLTNAFSKKIDNHIHMGALYTVWYNYIRQHKTHRLSPAMAAGLTDKLWSMTDLAEMVERTLPKASSRGPYKKRDPNMDNRQKELADFAKAEADIVDGERRITEQRALVERLGVCGGRDAALAEKLLLSLEGHST
jgi:hypothetical protein